MRSHGVLHFRRHLFQADAHPTFGWLV
jgi:hypothetical protein